MSLKETIFSMMLEALELSEAAEVSQDRYMGAHGKKARDTGQSGNWMFTHKSKGDVDYNDEKEVHSTRGKFADAKKSAQKWAKEHGHSTVYVMEEVEQIDEISDEKKKEYIRAVADKGGILRKPRPGSLKGFDRKKDDALVKAFKGGSMQDYANLHKKSEKRAGIALNALNSLKKEEVELDEVSKATLGSYIKKASVDASEKRMKSDRLNTAAYSGKNNNDEFMALDRGANKAYKSSQNRLKGIAKATDRLTKEEVELDEAKTDIYHKHMLKALGKTKLPKDHNYTSAIANNGDFVVHNAGRVVGRIAKGEHDLK